MMSPSSGSIVHLAWGAGVLGTRLPVAMTPLALVFLGSQVYDSYTYGLVLVGLYATAEACFAPILGMRLTGSYFQREVTIGLFLSGGSYGLLAVLGVGGAPYAWGLVILAGAGAAAVPGALRVAVTTIVSRDQIRQAFSVETVITMGSWAAAPALVAFVSFSFSPLLVITCCCLLMLISLIIIRVLPEGQSPTEEQSQGSTSGRVRMRELVSAWPIFLSATVAMSIVSFLELLLPALLDERGTDPAQSGPLISVIAVASIAGAALYGILKLPSSYAIQSWAAIAVMLSAVGFFAYIEALPYLICLLCLLGLGQSVCIVARNLDLQERLPANLHVTGFAMLYSQSGVGYGLSAGVSALALSVVSAQTTILIGLSCILAACAVAGTVQVVLRDTQSTN